MDGWHIQVDQTVCIGSGYCYGTAPNHFHRDGTKSRPARPVMAPAELLRLAAEGCPVEAISVWDGETTVVPGAGRG
jgi:ferredoxin